MNRDDIRELRADIRRVLADVADAMSAMDDKAQDPNFRVGYAIGTFRHIGIVLNRVMEDLPEVR